MSYVVIYDYRPDLTEPSHTEEFYYGYFSSPDEAVRMYAALVGDGQRFYANARLCKVVTAIGPEEFISDRYPHGDWVYEVDNGDTLLGYFDWIEHKTEAEDVVG